jgi:hypothetical protein
MIREERRIDKRADQSIDADSREQSIQSEGKSEVKIVSTATTIKRTLVYDVPGAGRNCCSPLRFAALVRACLSSKLNRYRQSNKTITIRCWFFTQNPCRSPSCCKRQRAIRVAKYEMRRKSVHTENQITQNERLEFDCISLPICPNASRKFQRSYAKKQNKTKQDKKHQNEPNRALKMLLFKSTVSPLSSCDRNCKRCLVQSSFIVSTCFIYCFLRLHNYAMGFVTVNNVSNTPKRWEHSIKTSNSLYASSCE